MQQLCVVFNALKSIFQQFEQEAGVGGAPVGALSSIGERPGLGVNELAAALHVRQPTASNLTKNLVKSLAQRELIEVRRCGPDRRTVQLHASARGRRVLRRAPGPFAGVLPQVLAALGPDTLRRPELDLDELIQHLGDEGSAGPRRVRPS